VPHSKIRATRSKGVDGREEHSFILPAGTVTFASIPTTTTSVSPGFLVQKLRVEISWRHRAPDGWGSGTGTVTAETVVWGPEVRLVPASAGSFRVTSCRGRVRSWDSDMSTRPRPHG
jgi:hypothetical protein